MKHIAANALVMKDCDLFVVVQGDAENTLKSKEFTEERLNNSTFTILSTLNCCIKNNCI